MMMSYNEHMSQYKAGLPGWGNGTDGFSPSLGTTKAKVDAMLNTIESAVDADFPPIVRKDAASPNISRCSPSGIADGSGANPLDIDYPPSAKGI
jgi:hypothetical protein